MTTRMSTIFSISMFFLVGVASGFATAVSAADTDTYQVNFQNSCAEEVQAKFNHAVTLLHSFEYPETTRLFAEIINEDADCAMAYWGAAMSIWHPLWAPPSVQDLEQGAEILSATGNLSKTAREAAFIDAARAFFSSTDPSTHAARAAMFASKMNTAYLQNLDDAEAALFYSLALLASADPRDKRYAYQYKSAGILNWVRETEPTHPGVLHYLIHSYDYPGLAHLALEAAKIYAAAAPDSAHAQHMPSHIFTRLGLWDRSIASNHDATRSAAEFTVRANLPGHYDEGLHGIDYLMYALLQTARDEEAKQLVIELGQIEKTDTENFKVAFTYAAAPARYALERRQWEEASELEFIREDFAWDEFGWAQAMVHFARGLGAVRAGKDEQAQRELERIIELKNELSSNALPYWRVEADVQVDTLRSWIVYSKGNVEDALALASAAADKEDAVDKHPVTPGEILPARELFADMLADAGKFADALQQYKRVLISAPNRLNALLGALHAAEKTGDAALAKIYREVVRNQTAAGSGARSELAALQAR